MTSATSSRAERQRPNVLCQRFLSTCGLGFSTCGSLPKWVDFCLRLFTARAAKQIPEQLFVAVKAAELASANEYE